MIILYCGISLKFKNDVRYNFFVCFLIWKVLGFLFIFKRKKYIYELFNIKFYNVIWIFLLIDNCLLLIIWYDVILCGGVLLLFVMYVMILVLIGVILFIFIV